MKNESQKGKKHLAQLFSCDFAKFLRTPFPTELPY